MRADVIARFCMAKQVIYVESLEKGGVSGCVFQEKSGNRWFVPNKEVNKFVTEMSTNKGPNQAP